MELRVGEDDLPVGQTALGPGLKHDLSGPSQVLATECDVGLDSGKSCSIWLKYFFNSTVKDTSLCPKFILLEILRILILQAK